MASPIYTTQVCAVPGFSGPASTVFTVPAGKLLVIKFMSVVWGDITGSGLDAWFQTGNGTKLLRFTWAFGFSTPLNLGGQYYVYGTMPVTAGDTVSIQTAAGTADFAAGGFLFDAP